MKTMCVELEMTPTLFLFSSSIVGKVLWNDKTPTSSLLPSQITWILSQSLNLKTTHVWKKSCVIVLFLFLL